MKRTDQQVFCIVCKQLVNRDESVSVFRTGFYKLTIPLAQCKRCCQSPLSNSTVSEQIQQTG